MKKIAIPILLSILSLNSRGDVIHFPYPYTGACYSLELIYSYELACKPRKTTDYWFGFGKVGWLGPNSRSAYGFEIAAERRLYIEKDIFKHFFISAYLGAAYMTDFNYLSNIGLVPGVKFNFKAKIPLNIIVEPYASFSVPISYELKGSFIPIAFPSLTFGARFGLSKLRNKVVKT